MLLLTPLSADLNAMTFAFPDQLLWPLQSHFNAHVRPFFEDPAQAELLQGGKYHNRVLPGEAYSLCSYDTDPLFWVANHSPITYQLFRDFFELTGLAEALKKFVKHRRSLVMYSGFFVVGNQAADPNWHYDYREGAPAYTLITPLFELQPGHGHLLYENPLHQRLRYRYQSREAIVFGEGFLHSTEPYAPHSNLRVLLSLTCGTDLLEYWPLLSQNIAEQSPYYVLPCGHAVGTCDCLEPGIWQKMWTRFKRI